MSKWHILRAGIRWLGAVALLITAVWGSPTRVLAADGDFFLRWQGAGNYGVAIAGIGMEDNDTETFSVDIPGTPVQAYLYWAGVDASGTEDNNLLLAVNGAAAVPITATIAYGPFFWDAGNSHFTFGVDLMVTAGVTLTSGNNTFEVSDFTTTFAFAERYGVGVIIVYENPALPLTTVILQDGLDSLFEGFSPPRGPNSEVHCLEFTADPTQTRLLDYYFLAGGVSVETGGNDRPVALWYMTGSGLLPAQVIDNPGADIISRPPDAYPFDSHNGPQWDTLTSADTDVGPLSIAPTDTWACFQAESVPDDGDLLGASLLMVSIAGSLRPPQQLASLGDRVWEDQNQNGIQDAGEAGVDGVTVNLYDGTGASLLASTTTAGGGLYLFSALTPGNYLVEFANLPAGYVFTAQDQGADDAADSDANSATGRTISTTLIADENDLTWDAGIYLPSQPGLLLGDFVWIDENKNGIQDAGEPVPPAITVRLHQDTVVETLDSPAVLATTTTNTSGFYQFDNLQPGEYQVEFVLPAGYTFTAQNQGADDAADSDPDPATGMTDLIALVQQDDLSWDAGLIAPVRPPDNPPQDDVTEEEQPSSGSAPAAAPTQAASGVTSLPSTGYPPAEPDQGDGDSLPLPLVGAILLAVLGGVVLALRSRR